MGIQTTVYGCITEMAFWMGPIQRNVRKHNSSVIKKLPVSSEWPVLSREMFSICNNYKDKSNLNFEYFGRAIHFGANFKSSEFDWENWRAKFEELLVELFFLEARLHIKIEYADLQTLTWEVDFDKYSVRRDYLIPDKISIDQCKFEYHYPNDI